MEPPEYDAIIRHLAVTIAKQEAINDDIRACVQEQREFNRQQVESNQQQLEFNADVKTTLARIETLLARV
jgi:predicted transcriptional regulator